MTGMDGIKWICLLTVALVLASACVCALDENNFSCHGGKSGGLQRKDESKTAGSTLVSISRRLNLDNKFTVTSDIYINAWVLH